MNSNRSRRSVPSWYIILLAGVAAAIIIFGITQLGTSTASTARTSTQDVTAENGVVQSTVSGSGEVEPGVDDTLNFGTSGTLQSVDVGVGQHVNRGELIATLDPSSAQLTLSEAELSLTEAQDNLTAVEDGTSTSSGSSGSGSSASGSSGSGTSQDVSYVTTSSTGSSSDSSARATTASVASARRPEDLGANDSTTTTSTDTTPTTTTDTTPTTTTPTVTVTTTVTVPIRSPTKAPTRTTTKTTTPAGKAPTSKKPTSHKPTSSAATRKGTTRPSTNTTRPSTSTTTPRTRTTPAATTTTTTPSATSIDQAQLQVEQAQATVTADKKALDDTKLYAPATGKIGSLSSYTIGETVSAGGNSSSASSSSDTSSTGAGSAGAGSSSSSSGFAELINSSNMTMAVSLSEDDISSVKVGQIATVSITALSGVELAGHVSSISPIGSDSSGVVSYDATITVTQSNPKVLPGMSATATIVTGQAQGVTVANEAISGSGSNATVQLVKKSHAVTQPVVVGLKGSSRSVIVSGLKAGQEVQETITLPSLGTSSSNSSTTSSSTSPFGSSGFPGRGGGVFGGGGGGFRALLGGGSG